MIILDTDIISLVQREESAEGLRVRARIAQLPPSEMTATTVITYEEQIQGWIAAIAKSRKPPHDAEREVEIYARLVKLIGNYRNIHILPYDRRAANRFEQLRSLKLRVGSNDLRIAAIVLSLGGTLITRNLIDFLRVPGLRAEDWSKA
jgi:tRNA(fMet)-specific endonuclease VapC